MRSDKPRFYGNFVRLLLHFGAAYVRSGGTNGTQAVSRRLDVDAGSRAVLYVMPN